MMATLKKIVGVKLRTLGFCFCFLNKGEMQKSFNMERCNGKRNFLKWLICLQCVEWILHEGKSQEQMRYWRMNFNRNNSSGDKYGKLRH